MVQQPFDEGDPSQSHPIRTKSHGSEADPRPKGSVPKLPGLDTEQSHRTTIAIAMGIVPEIVAMVIGEKLGFDDQKVGARSQHPDDLRAYFSTGTWRGWPVEQRAFEDWFRDESQPF